MSDVQAIDPAVARRGRITLLITTFLMWGGFFMVIPLLSVRYVDQLGWTAASIGLILAVRQLTQHGLTPLSGVLADRFGAKGLICLGLFLRAVGFACMAWASTFSLLMLSAILAALGGSMFEAPKNAAITALTDTTNRQRFFGLVGVISGLGVTLGTQTGALLLRADFAFVALTAAGCFLATCLVTLLFLPSVRVADKQPTLTYGIGLALHDHAFMRFNVLLLGYWFMWVQFSITLPLAAKSLSGTADAVGWVYGINSGMSILLQYPLLRLTERWLQPMMTLVLGMVLMAIGFGSIAFIGSIAALLVCVVLISAGTLLTQPSQQTISADLANPAALGSYYGINSLAIAFGGGLGNYSGGWLYDLGLRLGAKPLPWLVFSAVGLAAALGLALVARQQKRLNQTVQPGS